MIVDSSSDQEEFDEKCLRALTFDCRLWSLWSLWAVRDIFKISSELREKNREMGLRKWALHLISSLSTRNNEDIKEISFTYSKKAKHKNISM